MAKTICLVTYELAPVNRGGAGVVIAALAEALAAAGNTVHVLADIPPEEVARYAEILRQRGIEGVTAHALVEVEPSAPGGSTIFQAKSAHFRAGLYRLASRIHFDLVEFFEYAGPAFDTVTLRADDDALSGTELAVRIHGSLGMIDQVEGAVHVSTERHAMYRMEEWALRLADAVIAPIESIGEQYRQIYGFDLARMRLCPPPMEALLKELGQPAEHDASATDVVFYGKLQAVKGCEVFVDAAVLLADARPQLGFALVGPDTHDAHGSMRAQLEARIPEPLRPRFHFVPFIQRSQLRELASRALCAVVPSRAESFCLAAHELHRVGAPLVVSDVTAFRDVFTHGQNCLKFDGSATQLAVQIERLAIDAELARRLALSGRSMHYPDVASIYAEPPRGRNRQPDAACFARREVASLGFWAAEHSRRHERLAQLERYEGSPGRRLVVAAGALRDRVRRPVQNLVKRFVD